MKTPGSLCSVRASTDLDISQIAGLCTQLQELKRDGLK
jgi:hypothetical protein